MQQLHSHSQELINYIIILESIEIKMKSLKRDFLGGHPIQVYIFDYVDKSTNGSMDAQR